MPKLETTITEIKQETPNVRSFYLNVEGEMTFKPGQHVIVFQETGKYHMGRPYSITTIPEELPKGRKGYVQQNLDAVPNWIENDFYLVGIHQMVEDTRKVLLDAGIPKEQIFTETE